jgi:hypothetical protein
LQVSDHPDYKSMHRAVNYDAPLVKRSSVCAITDAIVTSL